MKTKTKNIICVLLIIVSVIGIGAVFYFIGSNSSTTQMPSPPMSRNKVDSKYICTLGILGAVFSFSFMYLVLSIKNSKFYENKDKLIIYILWSIVITMAFVILVNYGISKYVLSSDIRKIEENTQKEDVILDKSNVIEEGTTDLSNMQTDVTITSGGTYTLTGKLNHSVIIDAASQEVRLVLNGVDISTSDTACIIGLSADKIVIVLAQDTQNTLTDCGNSEYDGCIFSCAPLEFEGEGTLTVNGMQNEGEGIATEAQNITFNGGTYIINSADDGINAGGDGATITINDGTFYIDASGDGIDSNKDAVINGGTIFVIGSDTGGDSGIDTDEGYVINGGTVVALGTDMIELPEDTSEQKTLAFNLTQAISKDTLVTLTKDGAPYISFVASKSFKTIIISTSDIDESSFAIYTESMEGNVSNYGIVKDIYTKENILSVNNLTEFTATRVINSF